MCDDKAPSTAGRLALWRELVLQLGSRGAEREPNPSPRPGTGVRGCRWPCFTTSVRTTTIASFGNPGCGQPLVQRPSHGNMAASRFIRTPLAPRNPLGNSLAGASTAAEADLPPDARCSLPISPAALVSASLQWHPPGGPRSRRTEGRRGGGAGRTLSDRRQSVSTAIQPEGPGGRRLVSYVTRRPRRSRTTRPDLLNTAACIDTCPPAASSTAAGPRGIYPGDAALNVGRRHVTRDDTLYTVQYDSKPGPTPPWPLPGGRVGPALRCSVLFSSEDLRGPCVSRHDDHAVGLRSAPKPPRLSLGQMCCPRSFPPHAPRNVSRRG